MVGMGLRLFLKYCRNYPIRIKPQLRMSWFDADSAFQKEVGPFGETGPQGEEERGSGCELPHFVSHLLGCNLLPNCFIQLSGIRHRHFESDKRDCPFVGFSIPFSIRAFFDSFPDCTRNADVFV
jgi:hypothetical protein